MRDSIKSVPSLAPPLTSTPGMVIFSRRPPDVYPIQEGNPASVCFGRCGEAPTVNRALRELRPIRFELVSPSSCAPASLSSSGDGTDRVIQGRYLLGRVVCTTP